MASLNRKVRKKTQLMAPGGGFVLAPIPALYAGVPWEKVLVLIEAWKKCRNYFRQEN